MQNNICTLIKTLFSVFSPLCFQHHAVLWFQVVTFLHTILLSEDLKFRTALVVCPLNTILNWDNEFKKWQRGTGWDKVHVCKTFQMCRFIAGLCDCLHSTP